MKNNLLKTAILFLTLFIFCIPLRAEERTDGVEGAEISSGPVIEGYGWALGLDVGTVILHTSAHDNYKPGIGFGAHFDYFIDSVFALNTALGYSYHPGKTGFQGLNNFYFDIGPKSRLVYDPVALFLSISPGFVWQSFKSPISDSAVSFMIDFGTGIDLLVSERITMGLLYKYHLVFDQDTSTAGVGTADFMSIMLKIDLKF